MSNTRRVVVLGNICRLHSMANLAKARLGAETVLHRLRGPLPDPEFDLAVVAVCGCMKSLAEEHQMEDIVKVLKHWSDAGADMGRVIFRPVMNDSYRSAVPDLGIPDDNFTQPGLGSDPWLGRAQAVLGLVA